MSSTVNPSKIDPKDIPTLAPDVVVTRADHDVAKPDPGGKPTASAAPKGAEAAAGAKAPPVDTTFRATSTDPVKGQARTSFGRRLLRGVVGVILTACVAGAAMLWQSHGDVVRRIVTRSVAPVVVALLSRKESPAVEEPSGAPVVQASVVPGAAAPSAPQSAADNPGATAASPSPAPEAAQLLQSLARELTNLRQDMEQMKAAIAELKASDDQMAREIVKASDRATDKALEQALRPKVSMASPPQAQPIAIPVRKPPQPAVARPVQSRPVSATPQAAAYVPRPSESRAAAPPPQSAAAPPMDLSAPPRPPGSLREQMP